MYQKEMNKGKGQVVISAHVGCFGGGFLPSAVVSEVCSIVVQSAIEHFYQQYMIPSMWTTLPTTTLPKYRKLLITYCSSLPRLNLLLFHVHDQKFHTNDIRLTNYLTNRSRRHRDVKFHFI